MASLDTWFDLALFPETKEALEEVTPLYNENHRLRTCHSVETVPLDSVVRTSVTLEAAPLELEQDRGLERPAAIHPAVDAQTARRAYVNEDLEKPTRIKTLVPFLSSSLERVINFGP